MIDSVVEALMSYVKRPTQFDPEKRGLRGFLTMAADGDLLNALAKRKRRREKEVLLPDVEVEALRGKKNIDGQDPESQLDAKRMRWEVAGLFEDPKDRDVVELILDGERSTEAFVEILRLDGLPIEEQRREVKRHKDRIKKRLERYGKSIRK